MTNNCNDDFSIPLSCKLNSIAHKNFQKPLLWEDYENKDIPIETVSDFWETFIEKRLPKPCVVIKWNELLYKYIDSNDAIFAIRYFGQASKTSPFRRGFYTDIKNDNYSFFYTDNSLAYFFFRMAYDDYCPSYDDFDNVMKMKKFPYKLAIGDYYYKEGKEEIYANVFDYSTRNPYVKDKHKLAHIYDAGRNFVFLDSVEKLSTMCGDYGSFPAGNLTDWVQNSDNKYIRYLTIDDDKKEKAKKWIQAEFLRFISPMNHILVPKQKSRNGTIYNQYTRYDGTTSYDIGEDPYLLAYVKEKMHERYTVNGVDHFKRFCEKIYPLDEHITDPGSMKINLYFSSCGINKVSKVNSISKKGTISPKNPVCKQKVNIQFNPSDQATFAKELIRIKKAEIVWHLKDGNSKNETWKANKFSDPSTLRGNITSKPFYRVNREQIDFIECKIIY